MDGMKPLTEDQIASIKKIKSIRDSNFVAHEYARDGTDTICYVYVDFDPATECSSFSGHLGEQSSVDLTDMMFERSQQIPTLVKALGKETTATRDATDGVLASYQQARRILNSDVSKSKKITKIRAIARLDAKLLKNLANLIGVNYGILGGCGSDDEDSQPVSFSIEPKASKAMLILEYDFERCSKVLDDPRDSEKCDYWQPIHANDNMLSGNYRYRVVWKDGQVQEARFPINERKRKTIKIEK